MLQDSTEFIAQIISMVRENRVYEAQLALDAAMVDSPELFAQLSVVAKLLLLGGDGRKDGINQTLAGVEVAPELDMLTAMTILDESKQRVSEQSEQVARLKGFLQNIQQSAPVEAVVGNPASEKQGQQQRLQRYLEQIQGSVARRQLDSRGRTITKLQRLASSYSRLQTDKTPEHPLVAALQSLQGLLKNPEVASGLNNGAYCDNPA